MPGYVGLANLGSNYAGGYWSTDAYVWDTLAAVRASLDSIARGYGYAAHVAEWDDDGTVHAGAYDDSRTPCTDTPTILLAYAEPPGALEALEHDGPYACDFIAYIGRDGHAHTSGNVEAYI